MNIYISGVGGQGTGMLSEILVRAIDYCGYDFKAVDTHGLAQRGGTVVSRIRFGEKVHTPFINSGEADLCLALEIHEAMRSMEQFLKKQGVLVYYFANWEPLGVRLGEQEKIKEENIKEYCTRNEIRDYKILDEDLEDARMQNIAVLGCLVKENLIEGLTATIMEKAMRNLMSGSLLEANLKVFRRNCR